MRRALAILFVFGCLVGMSVKELTGAAAPVVAASPAEYVAIERFLEEVEKPPVANQARRRLEAWSPRLNESGWMEVITQYHPDTGFRYWVMAEGGSERIRRRVLKSVLDTEQRNSAPDQWRHGRLSRANYRFDFDGRAGRGMLRMQLIPRRSDTRLVEGSALLTAASGDLVRVEGQLAKSPSWWVRWVKITRSFSPIAGSMMPVAAESTADVRIAGLSNFSMTYEYEIVDGVVVDTSRHVTAR